jgi:hypothetical protein
MDNIIDLVATDATASEISGGIKDALYAKAAGKIEALRPEVANTMFNELESETTEVEETEE